MLVGGLGEGHFLQSSCSGKAFPLLARQCYYSNNRLTLACKKGDYKENIPIGAVKKQNEHSSYLIQRLRQF